MPAARKLVLVMIDSLKTEMLERAIATGRAPAMAALRDAGTLVPDCVSTYPSVTPVASATIATGRGPDAHRIPSMNWYLRGEDRYVEYGSSWPATRTFGFVRTLIDTVYNMNLAHLAPEVPTVFETLQDAGLRTACTTYLIYRGRTRHEVAAEGLARRLTDAATFRHATWGPQELYYGELFAARRTGCKPTLTPGTRDEYTGCVGAFLAENDLYDFLLFSLPDNDFHSHRRGPHGTLTSIAWADRNIERLIEASGGLDAFLERNAVVLLADHSQTPVTERIQLAERLRTWRVLQPNDPAPEEAEIAVSPCSRSAMVYLLGAAGERHAMLERVLRELRRVEGIDLVFILYGDEARVWSHRGELRFAPGAALRDERGNGWDLEGDHAALELRVEDGVVRSDEYPLSLARIWAALRCPGSGDVLASAAPGYEFTDWGGADHVGGGSHGSLHRGDSLGPLLFAGCGADAGIERERWALQDVVPEVLAHFGVAEPGPA